jgi:hypothetical protein
MPMLTARKWNKLLSGFSLVLWTVLSATGQKLASNPADLAQHQVTAYLAKLADLHCNESVTQQKLVGNGHVEASERAKYDYLIMINGNGDDFQLNESRIESSASKHKALPMLVTNGFSTILLIFHPYYRDSFQFTTGADEIIAGRPAIPVHFSHINGRRSPAALALRGREFPLELEGTAWLDKQTGEVVKMDARLQNDMKDVGLRSLSIHVEYKPTSLGSNSAPMTLPTMAVVDVTTPRQHWRNTHIFDSYKTFSTDAEPDPNVKVLAANAATGNDHTAAMITTDSKEKP